MKYGHRIWKQNGDCRVCDGKRKKNPAMVATHKTVSTNKLK